MKVVIKNYRGITHRQFLNATEKDSCRESFSGIWIDLVNKCFVGTDGHILVTYPLEIVSVEGLEDVSNFRKILPLDLFKVTQHNVSKKNFSEIEYVLFDDLVEASHNKFSCSMKYVDSNFPNYTSTIPNDLTVKSGIDSIRLNNRTIQKLTRALPDIRFDMTLYDNKKAVLFKEHLVEDENYKPIIAILMPWSKIQ